LLSNAYDAVISLSTEKWVQLNIEDQIDTVKISVTDSGEGISPSLRDRIFQPFFSTKKEHQALGLGLAASKIIVESLGGKVCLDSKCANTCFVVDVPKMNRARLEKAAA
jgi:C4-dicarboxylate-specific signal transduction histidine kinase